ncbi:hypothetical protein PAXRUDRAFT_157908 [Paxillus rubicundulus Ve08.2h10]|uniref:ATP-dependent DNA helicase n=1 Tax=Paxillus rubicundulus Ve08.2h10 TaxID=930991 RepID=A0A0D0CDA7_9AGAM|nr:hypothetical protein PAXRUDRAFT_157908 [Paxillus rubicundulus Ve08.2h10]
MISRRDGTPSALTKAKLQQTWKEIKYNIIDEFSMLAKTFLARMSANVSIGKDGEAERSRGMSFGGISVILCGDMHQFPPVATSLREALFYPPAPNRDSTLCQVGRTIYEEFTTVIILKQQMRVVDPIWIDFLQHLRHGHVQQCHMDMLHRMELAHPDCVPMDFSAPPWNKSVLITPQHGVRTKWNDCALRKHCQDANQSLFVSHAEDHINGRTLQKCEQVVVQHRQKSSKCTGDDLPEIIELAVGMRMMVTRNLDTDLDITNGARGTIVNIVVDADELLSTDDNNVIHLCCPLTFVLVKMDKTRATPLEGLQESIIPIEPISKSF